MTEKFGQSIPAQAIAAETAAAARSGKCCLQAEMSLYGDYIR